MEDYGFVRLMEAASEVIEELGLPAAATASVIAKMSLGHTLHAADCWRQDFNWKQELADELRDIIGYLAIARARGEDGKLHWSALRQAIQALWWEIIPEEMMNDEDPVEGRNSSNKR